MEYSMDKIVSLAKARGFVYPGSEIYGGLANSWDYGNLGVELKNNIKKAWWDKFIKQSRYNVGIDCSYSYEPTELGKLQVISADSLIHLWTVRNVMSVSELISLLKSGLRRTTTNSTSSVDGWTKEAMKEFIDEHNIKCPSCGAHNFTDIRQFNLMFKTFQGVTEDAKNTVYLRPETAQGIFVNFKNVAENIKKEASFRYRTDW